MRLYEIAALVAALALASGAAAERVFVHFEDNNPGDNVAGLGTIHPNLDIQPLRSGGVLSVIQTFDRATLIYKAPNSPNTALGKWNTNNALEDRNGDIVDSTRGDFVEGMVANGFADMHCAKYGPTDFWCPQEFLISFGNREVYKFKMLMVDFGDINPGVSVDHQVLLRGYDALGQIIAEYEIYYTTEPVRSPRWCSLGFNPYTEADACLCEQTPIGHIHMELHAPPGSSGIERVELSVPVGADPDSAFDSLSIGYVNLIDIKPTSCPNPINRGANGVLPVAVLGTDEFDVHDVEPSTCKLEGVEPIRWGYEDVSRPYVGDLSHKNNCTTDGPDGFTDLTFKFDYQEIASGLAGAGRGDVLILSLACTLTSGDPFVSEDVVVIVK